MRTQASTTGSGTRVSSPKGEALGGVDKLNTHVAKVHEAAPVSILTPERNIVHHGFALMKACFGGTRQEQDAP